jgi:hypothetical protein
LSAAQINMAGTRLLLQGVILAELLCVVLLSIHVGFCQPRLRSPSKENGYPHVLIKEDYFHTDPILCLWKCITNASGYDNNPDGKSRRATDSNTFSPTIKKLRYLLVLEDVSQLSTWASIVEKEWNVPSYLEQLETVQIEKSIQVHVAPLMHELLSWPHTNFSIPISLSMANETLLELWNNLGKHNIADLVDKETSVLILYIPKMLETELKRNDIDDGITVETIAGPPLPVRSFQLEFSSAGKTLETDTWLLLPTTKDIDGHLASYMDRWTFQAILSSSPFEGLDEETAFWIMLQARWKQQALEMHQYISTLPPVKNTLDNLVLPTNDLPMTNLPDLQSAVSQWQNFCLSLQVLLLLHTGSTKIPPTLPPPLFQDFPMEHYAAIFMPLLFPLLVPFLVSSIKEYKRWKDKRKSKGEELGLSNNNDPIKAKVT